MIASDDHVHPAWHMLDGRDPDECYKTMMADQTYLIEAGRKSLVFALAAETERGLLYEYSKIGSSTHASTATQTPITPSH